MKALFYNAAENRLKAGWRISIFFALLVAFSSGIMLGLEIVLGGRPAPGLGREFVMIGTAAVVITLLLGPARRFLDKRDVLSLGLRFDALAVKDLLFGWALSGIMAGIFFTTLVLTDSLEVSSVAWNETGWMVPLLGWFALYLLVGYWEELLFRGYLFDNFVAGMGLFWAILVSCLLYGLMHMGNPNASLLSGTIIIMFGFLRLFGLLSTKQLWLSMGMHMGWNFFQGTIFGFGASGHDGFHLVHQTTNGASWWTGGEFGPEASVLIIPILAFGLYAMHLWSTNVQPDRRVLGE